MNTALYQQAYIATIASLLVTIIVLPFLTELLPDLIELLLTNSVKSFKDKDIKNPIKRYLTTAFVFMSMSAAVLGIALEINIFSGASKAFMHLLIESILILVIHTVLYVPFLVAFYLTLVSIFIIVNKIVNKFIPAGKQ
jgi:hypothetical protein